MTEPIPDPAPELTTPVELAPRRRGGVVHKPPPPRAEIITEVKATVKLRGPFTGECAGDTHTFETAASRCRCGKLTW